jgi:hypothetical protein
MKGKEKLDLNNRKVNRQTQKKTGNKRTTKTSAGDSV